MKLLFDHEARHRVCPFREPTRYPDGTSSTYAYCVARDCMAWVERVEVVFYNDAPPFERTAAAGALKGYCGAVKHGM